MLCKNCGNPIPENETHCANCGAQLTSETEAQNPYTQYEKDTNTDPVAQTSGTEQTNFASPNFEREEKPKAKKKKGKKILIAAAAIMLVISVLVAFNISALQGFYLRNFGSSVDYYKYVESNTLEQYSKEISKGYGNLLKMGGGSAASKGQIKLTVGESAVEILNSLAAGTATSFDISWLKSLAVDYSMNTKDDRTESNMDINLNGAQILDISTIVDMKDGNMFLGLLNLSDKYIKYALTNDGHPAYDDYPGEDSFDSELDFSKIMEHYESIAEVLPSEKEFNKLLDKYLGIIVSHFKDADKKSETVEIDGISQKLTVIEFTIDSDTLDEIATDVLTQIKEDAEIKKYIQAVAECLEEKDVIEYANKLYDEFIDSVDDALELIAEDDNENEELFVLTNYVASNHEIVGRTIEADGKEELSYITVKQGNKFASKVELGDDFSIEGSGSVKKDLVSAEYTVSAAEGEDGMKKLLKIEVIDHDLKKLDEGCLNGTYRFSLNSELIKRLGAEEEVATYLALLNFKIELKVQSEKQSSECELNLVNSDGEVLVGISMSAAITEAGDVEIPSDTVDMDDQYSSIEYFKTVDLDALVAALEKADLPESFMAQVREFVREFKRELAAIG